METSLQKAFAEAAKLPEAEQELLASRLLAELSAVDGEAGRTGGGGPSGTSRRFHRSPGPATTLNSRTTRRFRTSFSPVAHPSPEFRDCFASCAVDMMGRAPLSRDPACRVAPPD